MYIYTVAGAILISYIMRNNVNSIQTLAPFFLHYAQNYKIINYIAHK